MAHLKKILLDYAPYTSDYFGLLVYLFRHGELVASRGSGFIYPDAFFVHGGYPPGIMYESGGVKYPNIWSPHEGGDILWEGEVEADEAIVEWEDVQAAGYVVTLVTKGKQFSVELTSTGVGGILSVTIKLSDSFPWLAAVVGGGIAVLALAKRR